MNARAPCTTIVLLGLLLTPAVSSAQSVREVAARVHESGGYGERLRVGPTGGGDDIVFGGGESARPDGDVGERPRSRRAPREIEIGSGSDGLSYVLFTLAIAAVVVLIVFLLARLRPRSAGLAPPHTPRVSSVPSAPSGRVLVDLDANPDTLAEQGRFAEAIAAALVAGLRAVGWRPQGLAKSRTAREILESVPFGDQRRGSLADLVLLEEHVAFGGSDASQARWEEARRHWLELTRERGGA